MFEWGEDASKILIDAMEGKYDPFVLILEGAIPDEAKAAPGVYCVIGEHDERLLKLSDTIDGLSKKCAAAVAIGTCASYGGIPHGNPNPTGAKGLLDYLGKGWKGALGLPVICIPGCPPRADNIVQVLGHAVLAARGIAPLPEIDEWHRPIYLYGNTIHKLCPICGFYAGGEDAHVFGKRVVSVHLAVKASSRTAMPQRCGWMDTEGAQEQESHALDVPTRTFQTRLLLHSSPKRLRVLLSLR